MYFRSDMHSITMSVDVNHDGIKEPLPWVWATFEGGNLEADDAHARPGGMGMEVSLGGPASRQDATLTVPMTDVVFAHHGLLETAVMDSGPVTITIQMLDRARGRITGALVSITGTLKGSKIPDLDVGSGDPGMYEVVVSCDEVAPV